MSLSLYSMFIINSWPILTQYLKCWNLERVFEANMLGKHIPDDVTINDFINEENSVINGVVEVDRSAKLYFKSE